MSDRRRGYLNELFDRIAQDTPYDDWALGAWDYVTKPRENLPWYGADEMDRITQGPTAYDQLDPALQQQLAIGMYAPGPGSMVMPTRENVEMSAEMMVPGYAQGVDQQNRNYLNTAADILMLAPPVGAALRSLGRGAGYLYDAVRGVDDVLDAPVAQLEAPQRRISGPESDLPAGGDPDAPAMALSDDMGPMVQPDDDLAPLLDDEIEMADFTGDYEWSNTTVPPSSATFIGGSRGLSQVEPTVASRMMLSENDVITRSQLPDSSIIDLSGVDSNASKFVQDTQASNARKNARYDETADYAVPGAFQSIADDQFRVPFESPIKWNDEWVASASRLDPVAANNNSKGWSVKLGDLMDAPELYKRYPDLKNTRVELVASRGGKEQREGTGGSYKNANRILIGLGEERFKEMERAHNLSLNSGDNDVQRSLFENERMGSLLTPMQTEVLLHELNHQIQRMEGRMEGGNNANIGQNMVENYFGDAREKLLNVNRADVGVNRLLDDDPVQRQKNLEVIEPIRALDAQLFTMQDEISDILARMPESDDMLQDLFDNPIENERLAELEEKYAKLSRERSELEDQYLNAPLRDAAGEAQDLYGTLKDYEMVREATLAQNAPNYRSRIIEQREADNMDLFPGTVNSGLSYSERELEAIKKLAANDPLNPQYIYNSIYGEAEARAAQNMANVPVEAINARGLENLFDVPASRTLTTEEDGLDPIFDGLYHEERTPYRYRGVDPEEVGEELSLSTDRPRTLKEFVDGKLDKEDFDPMMDRADGDRKLIDNINFSNERYPDTSRAEAEALGLWHPIGVDKRLRRPLAEMTAKYSPDPERPMMDKQLINIEDLYNKTIVPIPGDRSLTGVMLDEVNGMPLGESVRLEGGPGFPRANRGSAWATNAPTKFVKAIQRLYDEGEEPVLAYTPMLHNSANFNNMFIDTTLELARGAGISPTTRKAFDKELRKTRRDWKGIDDPESMTDLETNGNLRHEFLRVAQLEEFQNAGFPDPAAVRKAITEPGLLDTERVPRHSGGQMIASTNESIINSSPLHEHKTYSTHLAGDYMGSLTGSWDGIPRDILFRDYVDRVSAEKPWTRSDRIGRSLDLADPYNARQKVDNQLIDEVYDYLYNMHEDR